MDATTGFPAARAWSISRQIASDAPTAPPGLSMRSTMAFTLSSAAASRMAAVAVSEPVPGPGGSPGFTPLRPGAITPVTWTTATRGAFLRPLGRARLAKRER